MANCGESGDIMWSGLGRGARCEQETVIEQVGAGKEIFKEIPAYWSSKKSSSRSGMFVRALKLREGVDGM